MGARFLSLTGALIGSRMAGDGARLLVFLCGFVLAVGTFLGGTSAASAHASLLRSTPVEDAVVQAAPEEIVLGFSETVTPLVIDLRAPDGTSSRLAA